MPNLWGCGMKHSVWSSLPLTLAITLFAAAQGRPGRPTTGGTSTGRRTTPTFPSASGTQRSTFVTGRVALDDGTPVTDSVAIQTNCRGQLRTRGYSDSKGYFSIELSSNNWHSLRAVMHPNPCRLRCAEMLAAAQRTNGNIVNCRQIFLDIRRGSWNWHHAFKTWALTMWER